MTNSREDDVRPPLTLIGPELSRRTCVTPPSVRRRSWRARHGRPKPVVNKRKQSPLLRPLPKRQRKTTSD
jgi:hypothetical protein